LYTRETMDLVRAYTTNFQFERETQHCRNDPGNCSNSTIASRPFLNFKLADLSRPGPLGPSSSLPAVGRLRALGAIKPRSNDIHARTMRFVARDRLASRRYVRPWKSLRNGQQSIATRARMNSSKGLEKRRQHGLASSVSFRQAFGGVSPRRPRRERRPRTSWRRSSSGTVAHTVGPGL
jgi:hypothetical protein